MILDSLSGLPWTIDTYPMRCVTHSFWFFPFILICIQHCGRHLFGSNRSAAYCHAIIGLPEAT
jgi:hypothetical protein